MILFDAHCLTNRFNVQNKEVRFGNFIFGPVVMRLFYHLKTVDLALKCFGDPELEGMFDQLISYQILVDMLYEQKRYADVLTVFQKIKTRQIQGGRYPRHVVTLVFAACYKDVSEAAVSPQVDGQPLICLFIHRTQPNRLNIPKICGKNWAKSATYR